MKRHDPNHLYIGCRWTGGPGSPSRKVDVPAMGKVMDVISVNTYSLNPKVAGLDGWADLAGVDVPILLGEHNIPLDTIKSHLPPFPVFSQEKRRQHIRSYYEAYIRSPRCVGLHWYKYKGGVSDSLVDPADEFTEDLSEGFREVSENLFQWRMEGPVNDR